MAEEENVQVEKKSKGKKGMGLKIILLIVALAVLGGGGFFAGKILSRGASAGGSNSAESSEGAEVKEKKQASHSPQGVISLEPFLVNLKDPPGSHYLRIRVDIGLTKKLTDSEAKEKGALISQVRHALVVILTSKTSEELLTVEGKEKLRQEVKEACSRLFTDPQVVDVYFSEFIIQL